MHDKKKKSNKKTINTFATAHLDTVWNWDFESTILKLLPKTLEKNFYLFEKYPSYRFNFEGAYRYALIEEYYPKEFEKMKKYVEDGKWCLTGSGWENGDVNIPSPEALIRNFLYGNNWFDEKFGKRTNDVFLPDCFGFGYALPSVASHCGLKGFTTQKLSWGSAYGIPFDIGKWYGVDGNYILADINPGSYYSGFLTFRDNLRLRGKLRENEKYSLDETTVFHGVGDRGGAPHEFSVRTLERQIKSNDTSDVRVISSSPTEFFDDLSKNTDTVEKLPEWRNELVMTEHGAGSYTSRTLSKRWNAQAEALGILAEETSVAAKSLGLDEYNEKLFEKSWKRIIAHQFHDDITGTSLGRVYLRSWNDYMLSINQFADEYTTAAGKIIDNIDTIWCKGTPVVVHNHVARRTASVVTVNIPIEKNARVFDENGTEIPSQKIDGETLCFYAEVGSLAFRVYDILPSDTAFSDTIHCESNGTELENDRYKVSINYDGDVDSIFDKKSGIELLRKPITFDLLKDNGDGMFPAWNLSYKELSKRKKGSPNLCDIVPLYEGACVSAIKVVKEYGESNFETIISLSRGSDVVKFETQVNWCEKKTLLKHNFSFTAENEKARYDLGLGSIQRGNNTPTLFEVPAQKWVSLTDRSGDYTCFVASDCKIGYDKPDDSTIRMTAIHTPKFDWRMNSRQSAMDLGLNRYTFVVGATDKNDLPAIESASSLLRTPMTVFTTGKHSGEMKSDEEFVRLSDRCVSLRAMKKAETSDETVVRFNNLTDEKRENVVFELPKFKILSSSVISGDERKISDYPVTDGKLVMSFEPFEIKSFALVCEKKPMREKSTIPALLPMNVRALSRDENRGFTELPFNQFSIPAPLCEKKILSGGDEFEFVTNIFQTNALLCGGKQIKVPKKAKKFVFLGASLLGDKQFAFTVGDNRVRVDVPDITEPVATGDLPYLGVSEKIKHAPVAVEFTHAHTDKKDLVAKQLYLFRFSIDVEGAETIRMPLEEGLLIMSAVFEFEKSETRLNSNLVDEVCDDYETVKVKRPGKIKKALEDVYDKFKDGFMDSEKYPFIGNM